MMTDEEANIRGMIYLPEASDDHPLGDWQTKLASTILLMLLLLGLLWLAACAAQPAASDVTMRLVCSSALAKPIIIYGTNDPRTEHGVDEHNGAYEAVCEGNLPP